MKLCKADVGTRIADIPTDVFVAYKDARVRSGSELFNGEQLTDTVMVG